MTIKLMKQILLSRPRSFILIAVLVLAIVGLYVFSALFQIPRLATLQNTWFEQRKAREQGARVDAASIYRQGNADLTVWRSRLAPKTDFTRVIGEIFEIAANNALSVGGITYKPNPVKDENVTVYTITFDVLGNYSAIKSFLGDIMCSREIMTIDSIALSNSKATEEAVDLKVQLSVYFTMEGK